MSPGWGWGWGMPSAEQAQVFPAHTRVPGGGPPPSSVLKAPAALRLGPVQLRPGLPVLTPSGSQLLGRTGLGPWRLPVVGYRHCGRGQVLLSGR